MLDENPSLYYEWWETLQQLDLPKIQQLASIHPHLIWTTRTEPSFLPSCSDTFQQYFDHSLGSSLGDLNTIHWLILNYRLDDAKTMVTYILNLVDVKDLNDNGYWGDRDNTMMHLVSALGYDDLALQLVELGVHANVPNSHGHLPHHVAQNETMAELLLNIKDNETLLPQQMSDDSDGLSPSTSCGTDSTQDHDQQPQQQQHQQQQQQQHQLMKTSSLPLPNIEQPPTPTPSPSTLRKHVKDDHYFRSGQVEQTKQKVLGDEQVELEKQRERRRKDIALLAQRSAVKNNPFVKRSEPTLATTLDSDHLSSHLSHNDTSTPNAAILRIQANDSNPGERKCKRNSKGINSLQTNSYVSSSIFRQGQPPLGGAKQSNLAHQQNIRQRLKKASIDKFNGTDSNSHHGDDDTESSSDQIMESLSESSSVVGVDPLNLPMTHSTNDKQTTLPATWITPLVTGDDSDNDSDTDSKSDQSMVSALSSTDIGMQDSDTSLAVSENNDQPAASDATTLESPMLVPPTSPSSTTSTPKPLTINTPVSSPPKAPNTNSPASLVAKASNTNTPEKLLVTSKKVEQSSKIQLEVKPSKLKRNDLLIRDHDIDAKRQSGSQKSHWSKELTSWVTILNREFSLNVDDDHQDHENTTSIEDLTLALENASKFSDMETGSTLLDNTRLDGAQQQPDSGPDGRKSNGTDETDKQEMSNRPMDHGEDECRRPGMAVTLHKDSEHSPRLYGSVSARRPTAIYAKKLPAFGSMKLTRNDGGDYSIDYPTTRNKKTFATNGNMPSGLSQSASSPSPSTSNAADQRHHHNHHQQGQSPPSSITSICDRGKLYVRVNSVNDILLPLPRDRAHVRCVIGDGRYEYMSRYEPLGQNIDFGFECIIDSHPNMIITLSLHVRPDYMLKKPLKRLFSSNRKRKGSLSAYVSNEDGAVGQTRFAIGDMIGACYKQPYSGCFYCFNAWHIHSAKDKTGTTTSSSSSASVTTSSSSSSLAHQQQELDQGVLKVIGNFKVQLLYLPVLNPSSPVPRNLHECDMAIRTQL